MFIRLSVSPYYGVSILVTTVMKVNEGWRNWWPNVQTVDRGSGATVPKKFFVYLNSSIDEIWFCFQVERMFGRRRVIELTCVLSVIIRDTFVFKETLYSAEMLRRRRRNSSDQVVLKCSIFFYFEEHYLPTASLERCKTRNVLVD